MPLYDFRNKETGEVLVDQNLKADQLDTFLENHSDYELILHFPRMISGSQERVWSKTSDQYRNKLTQIRRDFPNSTIND